MKGGPLFLGMKLPDDIAYFNFISTFEFYRKQGENWVSIGGIPKPYRTQPPEVWREQLEKLGIQIK